MDSTTEFFFSQEVFDGGYGDHAHSSSSSTTSSLSGDMAEAPFTFTDFNTNSIFNHNELESDIFSSPVSDEMDILMPEMTDFSKLLEEGDLGPLLSAEELEVHNQHHSPSFNMGHNHTPFNDSNSPPGAGPLLPMTDDETTNSNTGSNSNCSSSQPSPQPPHQDNQDHQGGFYEAFSPKGSPSCMMDSPPLTPPDVKVDTTHQFIIGNGNILTLTALPKLLPVSLQSSKRGRSASHDDSPDVQALKRHIRMIRNRESASLSRKNKKEYVTSLEGRIHELEVEVQTLKEENKALKSRLEGDGKGPGSNPPPSSKSSKGHLGSKGRLTVAAKVALFGLCCFVISFHPTARRGGVGEEGTPTSNLTFSRTFGVQEENGANMPLLSTVGRVRRWTTEEEEANERYLNVTSWAGEDSNSTASFPLTNNTTTASASGMELRNRTLYEQSKSEHNKNKTRSRLRSSSGKNKNRNSRNSSSIKEKENVAPQLAFSSARSLFNSASLIFPKFGVPFGANSSTGGDSEGSSKCPSYFNKTESMRVQNDLEGIFGKRFTRKRQSPFKPLMRKRNVPLVTGGGIGPLTNNLEDFNKGLTIYEGGAASAESNSGRGAYSNILEKLERREDTFYVVSLASDSQLLLSAKAANESSRPKMTFLLPWRNETLKEDMILQIDCEVFQVFNLNKNQPGVKVKAVKAPIKK